MIRRLLILWIITLSALRCFSQVNSDDLLRSTVKQNGQAEVIIPYTNQIFAGYLTRNVSILNLKDKLIHVSLSPLTVEWFIHQNYNYSIVDHKSLKGLETAQSSSKAMNWDVYPTYTQYDSIIHSFTGLYPDLCRLDTIGTSINGKLILALRISVDTRKKPAVFYTSTMHGDETGGFVLMLHFADYLLKNYPLNIRVKSLVDSLEIWINPLANPDGTYRAGNTITSPVRYNANGYDLNRNFPDPFTPGTIRQKETTDMVAFMRKHRFILSANFHSGVEVVNYPWDRWFSKIHPDDSWFNSISRAYADTVHIYAGPAYMNYLDNGVTRGALWYIVYGGRQDFTTWELQGREVTIELDDQYVTPAAQLTLLWQNNWHSLIGYLENALYGIHGLVIDADTRLPVHATVFITGHDADSSQVYSDSLNGRFVRYLSPGSWNLSFAAKGYMPLEKDNVVVNSGESTILVAEMKALVNSVEKQYPDKPVHIYPNPANNYVSVLLSDSISGIINIRVINQTGGVVADYNDEAKSGIPLKIDLKSLSAGAYTILFKGKGTGNFSYARVVVIR